MTSTPAIQGPNNHLEGHYVNQNVKGFGEYWKQGISRSKRMGGLLFSGRDITVENVSSNTT